MFHALDHDNAPASFAPASFERALKKWRAAGWRAISLDDAVRHVRDAAPFPARSFVLTFDDGYASVYRVAFPLLRQHNMTATVFVAPGEKNARGSTALPTLYEREMLRWHEIREMRAYGITFGAHSLTHRDLTRLDNATLDRELRAPQALLADALGEPVPLFAYPFGKYDARVRALTAQHYAAAVSDHLGLTTLRSDTYALERVETFYLRAAWAADGLTQDWFPFYLALRRVPRAFRKRVVSSLSGSTRPATP